MSFAFRRLPDPGPARKTRDRLELLQALIGAPGFDPLYRAEVITIPRGDEVYRWWCRVPECERPRSCQVDYCHAHAHEWKIYAARRPEGASTPGFLAIAEPLAVTEGFEPMACSICPERPSHSQKWGLCRRHLQRWSGYRQRPDTDADLDSWVTTQVPFPGQGICRAKVCERLVVTPLGLCGFHEAKYIAAGRPGGASLPHHWVRRLEPLGEPIPVLAENMAMFRRWCAQAAPAHAINQINLVGLRPLAKAELQWGLEAHARMVEHTNWTVPWIRRLSDLCRDTEVDSLADLDLPSCCASNRMIAGEILTGLRPVYFTKDDSKHAGFIEAAHFGRRILQSDGYWDLTAVPQRWLRDLLWDHLSDTFQSVDCPRSRTPFDVTRRAVLEVGAFLALDAPGGGHDPSLLGREHVDRFVTDYRHRAHNRLPSLVLSRSDGKPSVVTDTTHKTTLTSCRRIFHEALESGKSDLVGLDRAFVTAFPRSGKVIPRRRRPFNDEAARALADETNLQQFHDTYDINNRGLRDAWEALVYTGRRCNEVLKLWLDCLGRYGNIPMLWHDQTKVGNYDEGIRIPERLFARLDERRTTTLRRFELRHGRPPTHEERLAMKLFPSRISNPKETRSISYGLFHRSFKDWVDGLDLGGNVPHQARHTLATRLLQAGATLTLIRKYLGQVSGHR